MPADPHAATVLTSTIGALSKTWEASPVGPRGTPYGQAYFHTLSRVPMGPTLPDLARALVLLTASPRACVIRGDMLPALRTAWERNHALPIRRTLDNFQDTPRGWACLDIDTPPPPNAPPVSLDPQGYAAAVLQSLPAPLASTSCAYQLSASAGIKPHKAGVHFWFLLSAPLPSPILRAWAPEVGADPALFHPVQVHYTAPPRFIGMPDPIPPGARVGIIERPSPHLDAAPIQAHGARLLRLQAIREDREAMERQAAQLARSANPYDGPRATCEEVAESFGIVTEEGEGGPLCDCPRHNSDSRTSLHLNRDRDAWYCFGCQQGGGPWALAQWCLGEDKATPDAIKAALRIAREGGSNA